MHVFGRRLEFAEFSWGFPQGKTRQEKGTPTANAQVNRNIERVYPYRINQAAPG